MKHIIFATSNKDKVRHAKTILAPFGYEPVQKHLHIVEIQAEDGEPVARDKAQKAWDIVKQPVVVNDDSWAVTGLKGFPGPYMASMNHYLSPQDFLRLFSTLTDRSVALHQHIVYQDQDGQQHFVRTLPGTLLTEVRGAEYPETARHPFLTITSLTPDGKSMAELAAQNKSSAALSGQRTAWHDLAEWLQNTKHHDQ